jgi:uncharacterized protein YndB with AHSA1/START domain
MSSNSNAEEQTMAKFEQHVTIDAPMDRVWAMMANPATWSQWFPDVDSINGLNAVEEGSTFQWQHGNKTGSASIVQVDHDRGLIKVVTTEDGKQTTHIFDLDKAGGFFGMGGNDTRLTYHREYDAAGGFLGEFVAGGNPKDMLDVKHSVEKIKNLAQG